MKKVLDFINSTILWYSPTLEYYLAIKRNELVIHSTIYTDLKDTRVSEKQSTSKGYMLPDSIHVTLLK